MDEVRFLHERINFFQSVLIIYISNNFLEFNKGGVLLPYISNLYCHALLLALVESVETMLFNSQ